MEIEDVRKDLEQLKITQATEVATTAGATATLAAAQAGLMMTVVVGSVSLIVGIFLGMTIVNVKAHTSRW
jgi:hypothetical protein